MLSQELGSDALFTQYIDVVNQAIGENRDNLYGTALSLWKMAVGEEKIAVGVYDSDADQPHHWYTIKLDKGTFDLVDNSKVDEAKYSWLIDDDHVGQVVDKPKEYIEQPLLLELQQRIGLA